MRTARPSSSPHARARRRYSDDHDAPRRHDQHRPSRHSSQHKRADSHRSRSSHDKRYDDRYDYDDRYTNDDLNDIYPPRQYEFPGEKPRQPYEYQHREGREPDRPISPFTAAGTATAAATAAGLAASQAAASNQRSKAPEHYSGYVPYANIYGTGDSNGAQHYPTHPRSSISSVQPNSMNQVTTSRVNAFSPEPSLLDGHNDMRHRRRAPRSANYYPDYHEDRYYDDYEGGDPYYDDHGYYGPYEHHEGRYHGGPPRPALRRRSFGDSFDSRDTPWRSPSPPRRHREKNDTLSQITNKAQRIRGKSMSRVKETFDNSQRGIGYGAVGAVAGGIVGSGVGKGAVPTAIGAVLGGLGANMFEARERKKDGARQQAFLQDDDVRARREHREEERRPRRGHSPV